MRRKDAYIIKDTQRYDLAYRTSVYWFLDGEGYTHFNHSVQKENLIDVVISHFNCTREKNPQLHSQLVECLGEVFYDTDLIFPEAFLADFDPYIISGERDDVIITQVKEIDKHLKFNLKQGGQLYIKKKHASEFGFCDLDFNAAGEVDLEYLSYSTSNVDIFISSEDQKIMTQWLKELVGNMNKVYERNGEQQIEILN